MGAFCRRAAQPSGRGAGNARRLRRSRAWPGLAAIAGVIVGTLAACGTVLPTPQPVTLTLAAPASAAALADELAAGYQAAYPHVTIRLAVVANSLAAEARLANGQADAALSARRPQVTAQRPLTATQLAWDAVALIVPRELPVSALTLEQAQRLFSGQLRSWAELDRGSWTVRPAVREDGAGPRSVVDAAVMAGAPTTPLALIMPGEDLMLDYVAQTPGALGYVSAAWLSAQPAARRSQVRSLAVDGRAPDPQAAAAGGYALALPIYLMTPESPAAAVAAFAVWAQGPAGRRIVQQRYGAPR